MAVEQQTTISVPVETAFAYLSDVSKHGEWATAGHKLEVKKTSEGPVGQGSTFESVGHQFGTNNDAIKITEFVPNQRVVYEVTGSAGVIRHSFEFAPAEGGTSVKKTFDPLQTKFPFALFAPMAKMFVVPGGLRGDLERIKARLEAS